MERFQASNSGPCSSFLKDEHAELYGEGSLDD